MGLTIVSDLAGDGRGGKGTIKGVRGRWELEAEDGTEPE